MGIDGQTAAGQPPLAGAYRSYTADPRTEAHSHLQLVVAAAGTLELTIDDQSGRVEPGRLAVIPPGVEHRYAGRGENRFLVIDASLSDVVPGAGDVGGGFVPIGERIRAAVGAIGVETRTGGLADPFVAGALRDYLLASLRPGPAELPRSSAAARDVAARVRHVIDERHAEPLTFGAIADAAAVSPRHAGRCFVEIHRQTPLAYLQARRVETAQALLADPSLSAGEVALRAGFASQSHFCRVFARHVGVSPGTWRRHALSETGNTLSVSD